MQGKKLKSSINNHNNTTTYKQNTGGLEHNIFINQLKGSSHKEDETFISTPKPLMARKNTLKNLELDWELYDIINRILEYTNVVLNDLEIFSSPEIYSTMIRSYHHVLPDQAIDKMLNSIYTITIDKNHRISNGRYNAMYSKDFIKTFSNIF